MGLERDASLTRIQGTLRRLSFTPKVYEMIQFEPVNARRENTSILLATKRWRLVRVVCANCHRMIHRNRPMLSVAGLRDLILQIQI